MEKITAKNILAFRKKSLKARYTLLKKLSGQSLDGAGGGDYWISCTSAVGSSYKHDKPQLIDDRIEELQNKLTQPQFETTRVMYTRNIEMLDNFKKVNLNRLKPKGKNTYLSQPESKSIIFLKGLPVKIKPQYVFAFENKGRREIGAIWFVANQDGYKKEELGLLSELLYGFLTHNYSNNYYVNADYCIALDIMSHKCVKHSQLLKGEIGSVLDTTLDEINMMLKKPIS